MKKKILVVIANYYTNIADELLKSALNELKNIHQTKIINVPVSYTHLTLPTKA